MVHSPITPTDEDKLWSGLGYAGLVCCLLPTLVIFLLKQGESEYMRFNLLQALGLGLFEVIYWLALGGLGKAGIAGQAPWIGAMLSLLLIVGLLGFIVLWPYLIVQSFRGKNVRIPVLAILIDQYLMG